jgi:hypothetical protein
MIPILLVSMMSPSSVTQATAPEAASPAIEYVFNKPQSDGSRHIKAVYESDTFLIRVSLDRISVQRRRKVFRRKDGPDQRAHDHRIARLLTGCELRNEFYVAGTFRLEADLECPASGNRVFQ